MKTRDTASARDDAQTFTARVARHYAMPAPSPEERATFDRRLAERLAERRLLDRFWQPAFVAAGAAAALALALLGGLRLGLPSSETGATVPVIADSTSGDGGSSSLGSTLLDQPEIVLLTLADETTDTSEDEDLELPADYQAIAGLFL